MEPTDLPGAPAPADRALISAKEAWFIPGAIVLAGFVLAGAVYVHRASQPEGTVEGDVALVRPVSPEFDRIAGNPQAPVTLITYMDIDSPHAKTFRTTLEQLMTEYGADGQVAWVYRHLPLIDQHPHAAAHAEAAECAASLGGPNAFWRFIDALNVRAPDDQQFNPRDYPGVVSSLGLLPQAFEECLNGNRFERKVSDDFENGMAVGAGGSPFSVLLVRGVSPVTIDGALPYDQLKEMLDAAVARASREASAAGEPAS